MMNVCSVTLKQWLGCYLENPQCTPNNANCQRVKKFVSGIPKNEAANEIRSCATVCRLKDNVYFAKTVSV